MITILPKMFHHRYNDIPITSLDKNQKFKLLENQMSMCLLIKTRESFVSATLLFIEIFRFPATEIYLIKKISFQAKISMYHF